VRALAVQYRQSLLDLGGQLDAVHGFEQAVLQCLQEGVLPELAAPVKYGVCLPPRGDQAGVGQHFQVMGQGRLADIENGAELGHAEGVLAQHPQHQQAQGVRAGFAQVGEGGQLRVWVRLLWRLGHRFCRCFNGV